MVRATVYVLSEEGIGKGNVWKYKVEDISSCLYKIISLVNKAHAWRISLLDELIPMMLVVCTRVKGVIYSIEISPYKVAGRGHEVDDIIHNLMYSWFLVDIKDLDLINSKL